MITDNDENGNEEYSFVNDTVKNCMTEHIKPIFFEMLHMTQRDIDDMVIFDLIAGLIGVYANDVDKISTEFAVSTMNILANAFFKVLNSVETEERHGGCPCHCQDDTTNGKIIQLLEAMNTILSVMKPHEHRDIIVDLEGIVVPIIAKIIRANICDEAIVPLTCTLSFKGSEKTWKFLEPIHKHILVKGRI